MGCKRPHRQNDNRRTSTAPVQDHSLAPSDSQHIHFRLHEAVASIGNRIERSAHRQIVQVGEDRPLGNSLNPGRHAKSKSIVVLQGTSKPTLEKADQPLVMAIGAPATTEASYSSMSTTIRRP